MNSTAKIIDGLGGSAEVSRRLGFDPSGGTQRVFNWITRDRIPAQIQLDHPDLFPPNVMRRVGMAATKPKSKREV